MIGEGKDVWLEKKAVLFKTEDTQSANDPLAEKASGLKIYLVVHATFEDTNVFYTTREAAEVALRGLAEKHEENEERFEIIVLEEGVAFEASFNC